jgi:hypothetical protein
MAANDESTSEYTGTDDSEEEEQEVTEVKSPKSKKKGHEAETTDLDVQQKKKVKQEGATVSKNDKGRFEQTPLKKINLGLPTSEEKRKKEDEDLKKAEKKHKKASPTASLMPSDQGRGGKFDGKELRTMLMSLYEGKDDRKAAEAFMTTFPKTTRTKNAVRGRITRLRKELREKLELVQKNEMETIGMQYYRIFFIITFTL